LNRRPLRPELAAPLGVCLLFQLTQGVGGSSCLLLSGDVLYFAAAVIGCPCKGLRRWGPKPLPRLAVGPVGSSASCLCCGGGVRIWDRRWPDGREGDLPFER